MKQTLKIKCTEDNVMFSVTRVENIIYLYLFFSLILLLIHLFIFLRIKYLFSVYIAFSSTYVNFKQSIFDKLNIFPMQHISTTINGTYGEGELHVRHLI